MVALPTIQGEDPVLLYVHRNMHSNFSFLYLFHDTLIECAWIRRP